MRYSAELAARATAWLGREAYATGPEGKRSAEGLLELATVWAAIQNVPLPACIRQCQYLERARDVAAYVREYQQFSTSSAAMSDTQPTATYQFKPEYAGQTLTADDYSKAVTADNLLDEDAEHFIKKGFGHVFQKIGAAVGSTGEGPAANSDADEPTEREQELQGEVDGLNQKLSEQTTSYNTEYRRITAALATEQAAHTTTTAALDSEKQAHATTKSELSEVQQQLATAQATITKLSTPKIKKAPADATPASSPVVADASASPTSSPTAGTDASADAATGTN